MAHANPEPVAVIDCGTNSTRLLIAGGGTVTLLRRMEITRLGAGVDDSGKLSSDAIDRVLTVLRSYRSEMDRFGVGLARLIATSAVRDAVNRDTFLHAVSDVMRFEPEVLDGKEEGSWAFAGSLAGLAPTSADRVVIDIGGGSTELIAGRSGILSPISLNIGCVRITERFFRHDPPDSDEARQATDFVSSEIESALRSTDGLRTLPPTTELVGLAGTVSTLASLDQALPAYDRDRIHGHFLSFEAVSRWTATLLAESAEERTRHPGLDPRRKEVIAGGALILREAMREMAMTTCIASESDLLDGVASDLLASRSAGSGGKTGHVTT